ncbi:hypothetical protein BDW42DRAFT_188323 [Aspergillus taichungensis]|uniref:Uncharacterized protein n=1 Tax=Aspergillus taichungensis TaxID=482145 RepID=A0A2J5HIW8_9EURO|nr:hypothetical protein BDW42DRAFT_188323 [Aspergillus taichungensis]
MKTSILGLAPLLGLTNALVGLGWDAENVPEEGLKDITFPIAIPHVTHESGYYFAQQYNFVGVKDVGYTGLQPRPDEKNGTSIMHGVFSSFVPGTTSDDPNCSDGADGGPGVSCAVEVPASYNYPYNLVIKNTEGTTWTGTMVNAVTKRAVHIGTYTLPAGSGGIAGGQLGFIEDYMGHTSHGETCNEEPYTNVTFGAPTTTHAGVNGSLSEPYEYGDCVGKVNFEINAIGKSWQISVGF